jgi:hypothetical protein
LRDERGGSCQGEIDADPGRFDAQIHDDRRCDHCRQGPGERDEGLLQEHRPEGEQEMIHEVRASLMSARQQGI